MWPGLQAPRCVLKTLWRPSPRMSSGTACCPAAAPRARSAFSSACQAAHGKLCVGISGACLST